MSKSHLSDIERGVRPLDSLRQLVALANALEIAPSELTKLPVPAPGNGNTDSATEAIRLMLDAVDTRRVEGLALPTTTLRAQVLQLQQWRRSCRFDEVAARLPSLIQNVHVALNTNNDHTELLELAVYMHVHVTRMWLVHAGAPTDLLRRVVFLTKRLSEEREADITTSVADFAVADALGMSGAFTLAHATAESIKIPATTAANAGFVCMTAMTRAIAAHHSEHTGEVAALMNSAEEISSRFGSTGEVDSLGFLVSPVDVGVFRMFLALEDDDPEQAVIIAQGVDPRDHPAVTIRTAYWMNYGRAMARLPGRQDDAVMALRTAESLFPSMVRREPIIREVISSLVTRARRDAVGRELRGMAYRVGVTV